jgi:hypothetical protein
MIARLESIPKSLFMILLHKFVFHTVFTVLEKTV